MANLVTDEFTESETTALASHVPNVSPGGVRWTPRSATWNVVANRATSQASSRAHATIAAGEADVVIEAQVFSLATGTTLNDITGVVARWSATTDYWVAGIIPAADSFVLVERNGNVFTQRAAATVVHGSEVHTVRLSAEGAVLEATLDGATELSYGGATLNQTVTEHGMMNRMNTSGIERLTIDSVAVAPVEIDMPPLTIPIVQVEPTIALGLVIGMPPLAIPIVLVGPAVSIGGGATADAVEQRYYLYVADDGSHWAVKVDRTWGEDPDSGAADWIPGTPTMTKRSNVQARRIVLQDPVSGRWTTRVVFRPDATAWVTPGFTTQIPIRGAAGLVTVQLIERRPEWIPRPHAIHHRPEPTTV